jgi:O-glycosyl hydrolase
MKRMCRAFFFSVMLGAARGQGLFSVNASHQHQVILGLGFEIQSDSIGSGNNGMPDVNTSVPLDLTPPERARFYTEMLGGFRLCRLALGLYFRGLSVDNKTMQDRWPGQSALLAEMAVAAGLEGFAVEYWSPAPFWKTNEAYIGGYLRDPENPAFLADFSSAVTADATYLNTRGVTVSWWGLQNEPVVGCDGRCIYSCCCIPDANYSLAFKATAAAIRAALPNTLIHVSSWSGQHFSPSLLRDPAALGLVDAWTFHRVGANSNDQIDNAAYFLNSTFGRPVLNNEFEYLDDKSNGNRTLNTAQSIMNWFTFENAPAWFWLHALKPSVNAEAAGYGLGIWQPPLDPNPNVPLQPGSWDFAPLNFNALAGFLRYMPWDAVRVDVREDTIRGDQRVLAYLFDPAIARWLHPPSRIAANRRNSSSRETLLNDTAARTAATQLGVVVTNSWVEHNFTSTIELVSATSPQTFSGFAFGPTKANAPLGKVVSSQGTDGLFAFSVNLAALEIQFWVEETS